MLPRIDSIADATFPGLVQHTILAHSGIERAIWITVLVTVLATIFSISILQLALGLLTVLLLVSLSNGSKKTFRSTPLDIPMLAFIMGRILSILFSLDPRTSVEALYIEIVFYAAFFVFTNTLRIRDQNEMDVLIRLFVLTAVVASVVGICKFAAGISQRASSTTSGAYTFSLYLTVVLPFILFLSRDRRIFRTTLHAYVAATILILGVFFSLDRMYWVVVAVTLVCAAIMKRERSPLVIYVFGMAVLILVVPTVAHRFRLILELPSHSSDRNILWQGAGMVYARHPFVGFGPRTFREVFPLMQQLADKGTSSWHNDFLQVYMESGLLGLIPLCWLVAAAVYWGARMLRSPVLAPESRRILLPFMCSILIFGLAGGMRDTVVGIVFRFDLAVLALMAANFQGKSVSINDG
jgi:O-antigen ligase